MDSRFRSLTPRPDKLTERAFVDPLSLIDEEDNVTNKQLVLIHKELDKIKSENRKKQAIIKKLKQDLQASKRSTSVLSEDKFSLDQRLQRLENYLETVIQKRKDEEADMKSYQYLLDRIKEDKHALDKELKRQQLDYSKHQRSLHTELGKTKKLQEINLREKMEIQNLSQSILKENKYYEANLSLIEKKALERSRAIMILEESSKHREQIADAAQSQISNTETIELRNRALLSKMWFFYLNKKFQAESDKGGILEAPFQKIKITTGMQNVEEILTRFLTREEAYKDLVTAVKDSENKLKSIKTDLESSALHLKSLKIKSGQEKEEPEEEFIRNTKRSLFNYKDMSKKYKFLIKNLTEWGKQQLVSMDVESNLEDLNQIIEKLKKETENLMKTSKERMASKQTTFDEILYLSTADMVKNKSFLKFFEGNRRVSPRKMSNSEDDSKLLIGN